MNAADSPSRPVPVANADNLPGMPIPSNLAPAPAPASVPAALAGVEALLNPRLVVATRPPLPPRNPLNSLSTSPPTSSSTTWLSEEGDERPFALALGHTTLARSGPSNNRTAFRDPIMKGIAFQLIKQYRFRGEMVGMLEPSVAIEGGRYAEAFCKTVKDLCAKSRLTELDRQKTGAVVIEGNLHLTGVCPSEADLKNILSFLFKYFPRAKFLFYSGELPLADRYEVMRGKLTPAAAARVKYANKAVLSREMQDFFGIPRSGGTPVHRGSTGGESPSPDGAASPLHGDTSPMARAASTGGPARTVSETDGARTITGGGVLASITARQASDMQVDLTGGETSPVNLALHGRAHTGPAAGRYTAVRTRSVTSPPGVTGLARSRVEASAAVLQEPLLRIWRDSPAVILVWDNTPAPPRDCLSWLRSCCVCFGRTTKPRAAVTPEPVVVSL